MTLPDDFQFSQHSLQDYVDCPRRFQLRYLNRVTWPAVEAEPALENERRLQQGAAFHKLVHQHALGIPVEQLSSALTDEELRRWLRNYLREPPPDLPPTRHPEVALSAPLDSYRLVAKYDLVAVEAGRRGVIVDWKTSRKRPSRKWLSQRLQTRVYPYLLVEASSQLNQGQPLQPQQVTMVYWFANFPADSEQFAYDLAQHEADQVYLTSLVKEIEDLATRAAQDPTEEVFPLTTNERHCHFCPYRSLCVRGVAAGPLAEMEEEVDAEEDFEFTIDFEQIAEIDYG